MHIIFASRPQVQLSKFINSLKSVSARLIFEKFAACSDGKTVTNPRHLQKTEEKLKHAQKALSRKQKNSNNCRKQKLKLAKLHARIRNQRRDFLHKQSRACK
ncbi:MAG: transposase [Thermoanaerobacteraceae bacterium]|nr:transposase [Thermoanaerobacteraceae bacterium]